MVHFFRISLSSHCPTTPCKPHFVAMIMIKVVMLHFLLRFPGILSPVHVAFAVPIPFAVSVPPVKTWRPTPAHPVVAIMPSVVSASRRRWSSIIPRSIIPTAPVVSFVARDICVYIWSSRPASAATTRTTPGRPSIAVVIVSRRRSSSWRPTITLPRWSAEIV